MVVKSLLLTRCYLQNISWQACCPMYKQQPSEESGLPGVQQCLALALQA